MDSPLYHLQPVRLGGGVMHSSFSRIFLSFGA